MPIRISDCPIRFIICATCTGPGTAAGKVSAGTGTAAAGAAGAEGGSGFGSESLTVAAGASGKVTAAELGGGGAAAGAAPVCATANCALAAFPSASRREPGAVCKLSFAVGLSEPFMGNGAAFAEAPLWGMPFGKPLLCALTLDAFAPLP